MPLKISFLNAGIENPGKYSGAGLLKLGIISVCFLSLFSCKKDFTEKLDEPRPAVPKTDKPNIILIFADDFGYELPHYTGGESYITPNLDYLAANGMQFTEMMSYPDGWPFPYGHVYG